MALNNYANLKAAIENWSKRNDLTNAVSGIDDYIDIAESEMYRDEIDQRGSIVSRGLLLRDMQYRAGPTTAPTTRFLALPSTDSSSNPIRFLKMRKLKVTSGGVDYDVRYRSPEAMNVKSGTNIPKYFTITSQIEFDRIPSGTIEMNYYGTIKDLDSTNTTNIILTDHPDIYLHGALWALFKWARNWEEASMHYREFRRAITGANMRDRRSMLGAAPASNREGSTP